MLHAKYSLNLKLVRFYDLQLYDDETTMVGAKVIMLFISLFFCFFCLFVCLHTNQVLTPPGYVSSHE